MNQEALIQEVPLPIASTKHREHRMHPALWVSSLMTVLSFAYMDHPPIITAVQAFQETVLIPATPLPFQGKFYQVEIPLDFSASGPDLFIARDMGFTIGRQSTLGLSLAEYVRLKVESFDYSVSSTIEEDILGGHRALTIKSQPKHLKSSSGNAESDHITITTTQIGDEFFHILFYEDTKDTQRNQQTRERIISSIKFH